MAVLGGPYRAAIEGWREGFLISSVFIPAWIPNHSSLGSQWWLSISLFFQLNMDHLGQRRNTVTEKGSKNYQSEIMAEDIFSLSDPRKIVQNHYHQLFQFIMVILHLFLTILKQFFPKVQAISSKSFLENPPFSMSLRNIKMVIKGLNTNSISEYCTIG